MTIIMNPPWKRGIQKKVFREACKHASVFSLQTIGGWNAHVGNVLRLLPLHTSVKKFGIALMPLSVHSNTGIGIQWNSAKCPTFEDYDCSGNEPLKAGLWNTSGTTKVCNGITLGQPLKMSGFNTSRTKVNNVAALKQEKECNPKTLLWFKTKKERTNYIKNISKLIALQNLFSTTIYPQKKDRLLPPLDKEYTKKELVEYFGFPWDIYQTFDDIDKEEPDSHYTSYEKWRDHRKNKFGLDWEEE